MKNHYDVAVIGGGIVGLANAWMASQKGLRVGLFEKSPVANGASVRNFGMIWPIGQPGGDPLETAMRSRDSWLQLGAAGVLDVQECGSMHLAHRDDELRVLEEFCDLRTHDARMLTASEVLNRSPISNPSGLLGGMWSPAELRVNPRVASAGIADWLAKSCGVDCFFDTLISEVDHPTVTASDQRQWTADRIVICSGSDLQTLFPKVFEESGLVPCKLQMLRTASQKQDFENAVHVASGLTLRHYKSFESCPSHAELKQRIAEETPELDRFGIHVMASPFRDGEVVLGDSHEYGKAITPFDKTEIDDLILRELRKVIQLDDWTIVERWHGIYAKHPEKLVFQEQVNHGTDVFVGPGGAGMTMSFGLAEAAWEKWS